MLRGSNRASKRVSTTSLRSSSKSLFSHKTHTQFSIAKPVSFPTASVASRSRFHTSAFVWEEEKPDIPSPEDLPPGDLTEQMSPELKELGDRLLQLSVMDSNVLAKYMKNKLGIKGDIGMGMAMGAAPAAGAQQEEAPKEEPKAEKTEFDVKLSSFDAKTKLKLIKEIRAIFSDMSLKEAKEMVDNAPSVVKKGMKKEEAEDVKKRLEEQGGSVDLE